jgi:hypothetical protein
VLSRKGNAPSGFEEVDWCVSASAKRTLHKRKIEVRNVGYMLLSELLEMLVGLGRFWLRLLEFIDTCLHKPTPTVPEMDWLVDF